MVFKRTKSTSGSRVEVSFWGKALDSINHGTNIGRGLARFDYRGAQGH